MKKRVCKIVLGFVVASLATVLVSCSSSNSEGEGSELENVYSKIEGSEKAQVYNLIIIDESGSMRSLEDAILQGLDSAITALKKAQIDYNATQEHFVTVATFSGCELMRGYTDEDIPYRPKKRVRVMIDKKPIEEVQYMVDSMGTDSVPCYINYRPYGSTPLFDAIGVTVTEIYNHIKDDASAVCVATIISDGYENSSEIYTVDSLKNLITKLTEEGWSFLYMGSAHNVDSAAAQIGITNTMEFEHTFEGTNNAYRSDIQAKKNYYRNIQQNWDREKYLSKKEKIKAKQNRAKQYQK